ncbi:hypothetical protein EJ03DRAFT_55981 [Teratosphaeria nubilosa]|uniref:Uncharacterized protein n=1 Tax=Teratosphaeria nubilosa TaxID=161662 RepID=A0A6G1LDZ9_9PEZI|nr:hypothetical protein EJ03DRAFT_55981 [Teratosphaeria nubilosa]
MGRFPRLCWLLLGLSVFITLTFVSFIPFRSPVGTKHSDAQVVVEPSSDQNLQDDINTQRQAEYQAYQRLHPTFRPTSKECTVENNCPVSSRPHLGTLDIVQPNETHCIESTLRLTDNAATPHQGLPASAAFWTTKDLAALQQQSINSTLQQRGDQRGPRTAVVLRAWHEFLWTPDDIDNVRTMMYQLLRGSGGDYQLFTLMQIRNDTADPGMQNVNLEAVPEVLRGLVEPWNQVQCRMAYPRMAYYEVVGQQFMPLQLFADRHPEFDYFWNLEMDVRLTGDYHTFFSRSADWARKQPTRGLWERNQRFYIPSYHGSYEDFANSILPDYSSYGSVEADLITYFPLFNTTSTSWMWQDAYFGYPLDTQRFGTVGTNMRLSRHLLDAMASENVKGKTMFAEMWPPSAAFLHDLKAVFVPHAIFLEGDWSAEALQRTFNAGPEGQVGAGNETVLDRQEIFEGSTWSWNAKYGRKVYEGWRGRRVDGGSEDGGIMGSGLCLPPVFLHPVKSSTVEPQGWH